MTERSLTNHPNDGASSPQCIHCGDPIATRFCAGCGHPALRGRLTIRRLAEDFAQQFLALDRGLWLTVSDLTRRPGAVVRAFLDGHRRRYVGPVTYLFFTSAVLLIAIEWAFGNVAGDTAETVARVSEGKHPLMTQAQALRLARAQELIGRQMLALSLGSALPFAWLLVRRFRGAALNLAETGVFALYTFAHANLMYVACIPLVLALGASTNARTLISLVVYLASIGRASQPVLGRGWRVVVRSMTTFVLAYFLFIIPLSIVMFAYAILSPR